MLGHTWLELRELIDEQVQRTHPQVYAVEEVVPITVGPVEFRHLLSSEEIKPSKARQEVMWVFEVHQPPPTSNRWRLSGVAKSLTFGAQTKYARLIEVVHQLAQSAEGAALPYLGFQILKLEQGQVLNQHRDYHNHADY